MTYTADDVKNLAAKLLNGARKHENGYTVAITMSDGAVFTAESASFESALDDVIAFNNNYDGEEYIVAVLFI